MSSPVLLVHGAWGGAWACGFVQAELEKLRVESKAIDVPSRDPAPSAMADDAAAVRAAHDGMSEPAVVAGHSYDDGMSTLDPAGAKRVLFNDVTHEQAAPIIAALGPHPLAVFGETPTALGCKEHPSTYVLCTQVV